MISQLHFFNPGHETAVLLGTANYTPPTNVQRMTRELSCLPVWYADSNDYVYTEESSFLPFFVQLPKELRPRATLVSDKALKELGTAHTKLAASPWGISPHSLHLFEQLKKTFNLNLSIPSWDPEYFRLTGRQTAAECLELIRQQAPGLSIPETPVFCTEIKEIEEFMNREKAPFVVKAPYSSSGRGLLWLSNKLTLKERNWIEGVISKQGAASMERGLEKQQDLAMEFYSDGKGNVSYEGLSVFGTEKRGAYSGNVLGSQESLSKSVKEWVGEAVYQQTQKAVTEALKSLYGKTYRGFLGVDMIVYKTGNNAYSLHPCIEINMRYTMGMVALRLSQRYLASSAIGHFNITYHNKDGEACERHCFMKKAYPLVIENGQIRKGYVSLCPVTKTTKYSAYLLVM